ncbi:hypothetical protein VII00023_17514 [Vibrio ichthyoenteri ATCC 700023]|uniref:Copper-binding protein n=1 Tax=Vibrio ichthyoenteri ATCC 700023 TaxID=870968 RepID=F9RXG2_9VIBR|nr:hypothetical protein VII00023_17514 [Vibrio ichthyoenteri ATCC 700023]
MKFVLLIGLLLSTPFTYAQSNHKHNDDSGMEHKSMDHANVEHGKIKAHDMNHNDMQSMPGMTSVGMPAQGAKADKVVHVILSDDKPIQFKKSVSIEQNDVVQFVVMNTGNQRHEFAIGSVEELKNHHTMMQQMAGMEHDTSSSILVEPKKDSPVYMAFPW